mmetsp:Transcript_32534/g.49776  ORF Transcript_32534/g.49776 Transcript_32534/m.49776 type:complete len:269 (+) Transcript_32534:156-962(+)
MYMKSTSQQHTLIIFPDDEKESIHDTALTSEDYSTFTTENEPSETKDEQACEKQGSVPVSSPSSTGVLSLLLVLCSSLHNIGFLISSVSLSMGTSVVERLIFIFFSELGTSNTMCGFTVAVTVIFEIPIFQLAPFMLKHFSPGTLLHIANVTYAIRVVGYTLIPQHAAWLIFLLEPLHGVTYGCAKTGQVEHVAVLASRGQEASAQGLMGLFVGLGSMIGLFVGGWTEDRFGAKFMYRLWAVVVVGGMLIFLLITTLERCIRSTIKKT